MNKTTDEDGNMIITISDKLKNKQKQKNNE